METKYNEAYNALKWYVDNKMSNEVVEESRLENLKTIRLFLTNTIHENLAKVRTKENETKIREMCQWVIEKILPFIKAKLKLINFKRVNSALDEKELVIFNDYLDLEDDFFAIASFRSLPHFAMYMERQDSEEDKVWKYTMDETMGSIFYYSNKMILEDDIHALVKQTPAGYGKCFHANQDILTSTGYKKAKDLKIGDLVYSMRENKAVLRKIINKWDTKKKQVKITARNGVELIVSPEHRMWTQRGYVQAKDLTTDDYLYYLFRPLEVHGNLDELIKTAKFRWIKIISIKNDDTEVPMIDLEVEDTHNFILDGFVSHNSKSDCVIMCFILGYDVNADIIKVVGNPTAMEGIVPRVVEMLKSKRFGKVFPVLGKYNGSDDMFKRQTISDNCIALADSTKAASLVCFNKETKTSGIRGNYQFYDDITQAEDAENVSKHERDVSTYQSVWSKREYNQFKTKRWFTGTSYNREDFICKMIDKYSKGLPLCVDMEIQKYKWAKFCKKTQNGKMVVIRIPKLVDLELGEDKCYCSFPEKFSKEEALDLLHSDAPNSRRSFYAMEQQSPLPPESMKFDWVYLRTYKKLPKDILDNNCFCRIIIDPSRKGKDNYAALIFKSIDGKKDWYLVDCYYEQKVTSKYAIPEICKKAAFHKADIISFEQNATDISLITDLIKKELLHNGDKECTVDDFWSQENKEEKILKYSDDILNDIIFPNREIFHIDSPMGRAMKDITCYSFDFKVAHDDSLDCCAMLESRLKQNNENTIEVLDYCNLY